MERPAANQDRRRAGLARARRFDRAAFVPLALPHGGYPNGHSHLSTPGRPGTVAERRRRRAVGAPAADRQPDRDPAVRRPHLSVLRARSRSRITRRGEMARGGGNRSGSSAGCAAELFRRELARAGFVQSDLAPCGFAGSGPSSSCRGRREALPACRGQGLATGDRSRRRKSRGDGRRPIASGEDPIIFFRFSLASFRKRAIL
jgi:hypothetical protein